MFTPQIVSHDKYTEVETSLTKQKVDFVLVDGDQKTDVLSLGFEATATAAEIRAELDKYAENYTQEQAQKAVQAEQDALDKNIDEVHNELMGETHNES